MGRAREGCIRTVLVDDHPQLLQTLRKSLERHERIEVVGTAVNGREAVEVVSSLDPDLLIMDVSMPEMDGLAATRLIKKRENAPRIVLVSLEPRPTREAAAIEAGADAFCDKGQFARKLLSLIDRLFPAD